MKNQNCVYDHKQGSKFIFLVSLDKNLPLHNHFDKIKDEECLNISLNIKVS